jgi:hypothetical protein
VADIVSPFETRYLWDEAARGYDARSRSVVWVYQLQEPVPISP